MRKILAMLAVAALSTSAIAVKPGKLINDYVLGVSPDGKLLASEYKGTVKFISTETGETVTFQGDDFTAYALGMGRPISEEGTIVGTVDNLPAYYRDGSWKNLNTPYPENFNLANSVTPDGSRICGSVGAGAFGVEDSNVPMQVPVVWNRNDDGTYGEPVFLPYPEKDYTGRVPQYVIALAISDAGNTVAGQMRDYSGFMTTLIFYTCENGAWVMHNDFASLANPNGLEIPPYPGDEPSAPSIYSFMTEEEIAAFNAAVAEWEATGLYDYSRYPQEENFMTPEEYQAYLKTCQQYQNDYEEWSVLLVAYDQAIQACDGQTLIFNNVLLNAEGTKAVSTGILYYEPLPGTMRKRESYTPIVFDLTEGTHTVYPDKGVNASYLAADGTILGFDGGVLKPRQTQIYLPGETEKPISLVEYFQNRDAVTCTWIKRYMKQSAVIYDEDGGSTTDDNFLCSGTPCASPDLSIIVCATENFWNSSSEVESYVLPDSSRASGVKDVVVAESDRVNVYALDGRRVSDGLTMKSDLPPGIYIVKKGAATTKVILR